MGVVSFDYDWIPGERPDGTVVGDPPVVHTVLELKTEFHTAQGVVTKTTPDSGITVLSIVVTEADDLQGFVDDVNVAQALGVRPIGLGKPDGSIELFPPESQAETDSD